MEAFYHYLLSYPLDDFDPYSPAPVTDAKKALIAINRKSPEQFWMEWSDGELDLPYQTCSVAQAYQAYLKWCTRTGERYPFKREQWTPTVTRFSEHVKPDKPVRVKVMKLGEIAATKKTERMFLTCDIPDPVTKGWSVDQSGLPAEERETQGSWATRCVMEFDKHLKTYMGYEPRSPGGKNANDGGDE